MITIMETYANSHNLKFSTNPVPSRCKTKVMAFIVKKTPLKQMFLCGNPLPWVTKFKHLGITVSNKINGCLEDMRIKNARYIDKNNQINQEFYFAHCSTKTLVNEIYNSHFTGSQCWDLFSEGSSRLEASWNRSIKIVHDLPWPTHRNLMVPISETTHMKSLLMTRLITFVSKLKESKKPVLRQLINMTMKNTRSVTGRNLRGILLLSSKSRIENLTVSDVKAIKYHPVSDEDMWRLPIIKEMLQMKSGEMEIPIGWSMEEMEEVLLEACTS